MADTMSDNITCAGCGTTVAPGWGFCVGCGRPIAETAMATDALGPKERAKAPVANPREIHNTEGQDAADNIVRIHDVAMAAEVQEAEEPANPIQPVGAEPAGPDQATTPMNLAISTTVPVRRRPRWLVPVVAGVVVIVLTALAITSDLGVRRNLDRTRQQLASSVRDLEGTAGQLGATKGELTTTRKQMETTTAERDTLKAEVEARVAELGGVRGSLNDAQSRVNLQAGQIETLKSCLNGISIALGYAADGSYGAVVASLNAVEVACDKSFELF